MIEAAAAKQRADADAAAAKQRADTDTAAVEKHELQRDLFFGAAALGAVALAADVVLHESRSAIYWRMWYKLKKPKLPASVRALRPHLLPRKQEQLKPSADRVALLMSPSGAGKCTLLKEIARDAVTGADGRPPTVAVLIQPRQSHERNLSAVKDSATEMDSLATRVLGQIGFPTRRSLLGGALARGFTWLGRWTQADLFPDSTQRLKMALELLFEVLREVSKKQSADTPKPLLMIDELHDFIKDTRLTRLGGPELFNLLGGDLQVAACRRRG